MVVTESTINDVYEIYSTYMTQLFYNKIYTLSKKSQINGQFESITEAYKYNVTELLKSICENDKIFINIITDTFKSFQNYTKYRILTLAEFVDLFLSCFIPEEYFGCMNKSAKDTFINRIFKRIINLFAKYVTSIDNISKIIDNRSADNASIFRIHHIELLKNEKSILFTEFLQKVRGSKTDDYLPKEMFNKMKKELKQLYNENKELKRRLKTYEQIIERNNYLIDQKNSNNEMISSREEPTYSASSMSTYRQSRNDYSSNNNNNVYSQQSITQQPKSEKTSYTDDHVVELTTKNKPFSKSEQFSNNSIFDTDNYENKSRTSKKKEKMFLNDSSESDTQSD